MINKEKNIFGSEKFIIGMVHVGALPGTPNYKGDFGAIVKEAVAEAKMYMNAGVHSVMLENMHDVPYLNKHVGEEIIAGMAVIASEVKQNINLPVGVQILAGANKAALAVAKAADLDYIRAEGFVFAHVADEGIISSAAGELMRYRKSIDAENVLVFTDIKKKHSSHAITSDVSIDETAKAAEFFLSDGVIVTGKSTSDKADIRELELVSSSVNIPVLIGSGITKENVADYIDLADGFIIGSYFKKDGKWFNPVDETKVRDFTSYFNSIIK